MNSRTGSDRAHAGCSGRSPTDQTTYCSGAGIAVNADWSSGRADLGMKGVAMVTEAVVEVLAGCTEDGETFSWEATVNNRTRPEREGCPGCSPYAPISLQKRLGKVPR